MESISLTVPLKEGPLRRASEMLAAMAEDCAIARNAKLVKVSEQPLADAFDEEGFESESDIALPPSAPEVFGDPVEPIVPEAPTATPSVELDTAGLPWDARIHVSTKTTKVDGTWKLKPRIDKGLVAQVEAELRAAMGAPVAAPLVPAAAPVITFPDLVQYITKKAHEGLPLPGQIEGVTQKHGLKNLQLVAARPDLIPAIHADLEKLWTPTQS